MNGKDMPHSMSVRCYEVPSPHERHHILYATKPYSYYNDTPYLSPRVLWGPHPCHYILDLMRDLSISMCVVFDWDIELYLCLCIFCMHSVWLFVSPTPSFRWMYLKPMDGWGGAKSTTWMGDTQPSLRTIRSIGVTQDHTQVGRMTHILIY